MHDEPRELAAVRIAVENPDQTLSPTALVNAAYLRLVGDQQFDGRGHFFAAAEAMRRVLVEAARRRSAEKRGGRMDRLPLSEVEVAAPEPDTVLASMEPWTNWPAPSPAQRRW